MESLEKLLKEKSSGLRYNMAQKMQFKVKKGEVNLIEPLAKAIKKEKDHMVKDQLRRLLSIIGTEAAVEAIKNTAYDDKSTYFAKYAIPELDRVKDVNKNIINQAKKEIFLTSKNVTIRKSVFLNLCYSRSSGDIEWLVDMCIEALKQERDYELGKFIIQFLHEKGKKVCFEKVNNTFNDLAKSHQSKKIKEEIKGFVQDQIEIGGKSCNMDKYGRLSIFTLKEGDMLNTNWGNQIDKIKKLSIFRTSIVSLEGIEKLTSLRSLDVRESNFDDYSSIKYMTNLSSLYMPNNKMTEIKYLDNLSNLSTLDLSGNLIEEISGLDNLKELKTLNLSNNKIMEIKGLEKLISLQDLDLGNNQIDSLKGLENSKNLTKINLYGNSLPSDITSVKDGQVIVAHSAGMPLASAKEKYRINEFSIKIKPLQRPIFELFGKDRCFYCNKPVASDGNQEEFTKEKLLEIITEINAKIPRQVEEKILSTGSNYQSVGYKRTTDSYSSFTTYNIKGPTKTVKEKKEVTANFYGPSFTSLGGIVCTKCSQSFLNSAMSNFSKVKTKGLAKNIIQSVKDAKSKHSALVSNWRDKLNI